MANATKTQDAVLKALYEITVRLQTMEAKQNGQLQAVEAKQKALEDQLKTLQSFTTQVKNEILAAIAKNSVPPEKFVTILSHLTEIRKATDGLPRPGWEKGGLDKPGDFWRWIYADVESTKEGIALLIKNQ
jgi:hypothetical protein